MIPVLDSFDSVDDTIIGQIDKIYEVAPDMKKEIDAIADNIASNIKGAKVAKTPNKKRATAIAKVLERKGGDVSKLSDVARNTIVVENERDIKRVIRALEDRGIVMSSKIYDGTGPLGYKGYTYKVMTKYGYQAEIQINTPGMIWAKEEKKKAKSILGDDTWEKINDKVDHTVGIKGGNGHVYYEEWRKDDIFGDEKAKIQKVSKAYYELVLQKYYGD